MVSANGAVVHMSCMEGSWSIGGSEFPVFSLKSSVVPRSDFVLSATLIDNFTFLLIYY